MPTARGLRNLHHLADLPGGKLVSVQKKQNAGASLVSQRSKAIQYGPRFGLLANLTGPDARNVSRVGVSAGFSGLRCSR